MSSTSFWKPVYQLFKPEEPLTQAEDLRDFYVQRSNSPIESLVTSLEMEDDPAKFLLAGHRGGGKTTELRRLEQELNNNYTVIWIDLKRLSIATILAMLRSWYSLVKKFVAKRFNRVGGRKKILDCLRNWKTA